MESNPRHKAGFVNIIGKPNAGKSTLMNELVGERMSIITAKAQTTRHRILGIVNDDQHQIVFSDLPGVIKPAYELQKAMMGVIHTALEDADIIIYLHDIKDPNIDEELLASINKCSVPVLCVLNKIDLIDQAALESAVEAWKARMPQAEVIPLSALEKFNTSYILSRIKALLPESPPYYDKEELTDRPMRFFVSEIVREKILLNYKKEIPYSCEVTVTEYKDEPDIIRIRAEIIVARESQKAIIIGHKGAALKKTGTEARLDLEKFLDKKVFIELHVKVNKDWRDDPLQLKRFGYNS